MPTSGAAQCVCDADKTSTHRWFCTYQMTKSPNGVNRTVNCPQCKHPMAQHVLLGDNYEQPDVGVSCGSCRCEHPAYWWTAEQRAEIP